LNLVTPYTHPNTPWVSTINFFTPVIVAIS
jgi:hypothetical protein